MIENKNIEVGSIYKTNKKDMLTLSHLTYIVDFDEMNAYPYLAEVIVEKGTKYCGHVTNAKRILTRFDVCGASICGNYSLGILKCKQANYEEFTIKPTELKTNNNWLSQYAIRDVLWMTYPLSVGLFICIILSMIMLKAMYPSLSNSSGIEVDLFKTACLSPVLSLIIIIGMTWTARKGGLFRLNGFNTKTGPFFSTRLGHDVEITNPFSKKHDKYPLEGKITIAQALYSNEVLIHEKVAKEMFWDQYGNCMSLNTGFNLKNKSLAKSIALISSKSTTLKLREEKRHIIHIPRMLNLLLRKAI